MIGYSVPVIVDAYFKGIDQFDHKLALEAMVQIADSAYLGKPALPSKASSFRSGTRIGIWGLEYAYNDWCIARLPKP